MGSPSRPFPGFLRRRWSKYPSDDQGGRLEGTQQTLYPWTGVSIMKAIDLAAASPTLGEVLKLAGEENVILKTPEGREFVLAEIDDFAQEIALVRQNGELMQLLAERSKETSKLKLKHVR